MGGQPSKIDESKRDESKGSNANLPTTSTADISSTHETTPRTFEIPKLEESPVKHAELSNVQKEHETNTTDATNTPNNPQTAPSEIGDIQETPSNTSEDQSQKLSDSAILNLAEFAADSKERSDSQLCTSAEPHADSKMKEVDSKCRLDSATNFVRKEPYNEKEQINAPPTVLRPETPVTQTFDNEKSPNTGRLSEKVKIGARDPNKEIMTSMSSIRQSVTDQEREHELIITRVSSSDRDSVVVNLVPDSIAVVTPSSSAKSLKDLEKSRKAFFMGLLEDTVEEIYPADLQNNSNDTKVEGDVRTEKSISTYDSSDFQTVLNSSECTNATLNTSHSDKAHLGSSDSTMDKQFDNFNEIEATPKVFSNPPNLANHPLFENEPSSSDSSNSPPENPQIGEISEKLISDGVYFAQAIETSSRPTSCEISGGLVENLGGTDDEKYSDVTGSHLDDSATGQTSTYAAHEPVNFEQSAPHFNYENESDEPIFKRFDSLEPEEQLGNFPQTMGELDCDDDESGFFGDLNSINENSADEKVTDSGFGNDVELDEILKTELDDISLDEFEGISIDVVISEVKSEDVKPDEGGNGREIVGNSGGNDVEIGEEAESVKEGGLGERPLGNDAVGKRGLLGKIPVQSAAPRDEQAVGMLTLSNLNESFPGKLTLSSALSSSSDESIGTKVKKHVRWADTDDGRSLESYDEYSSGDDEYSSDVGGFEDVAKVVEDVPAAGDEDDDEEDDDDEDTSEDEESDAEENK